MFLRTLEYKKQEDIMRRPVRRRLPRRLERQIEEAATAQKDRVRETAAKLNEAQRRSNIAADRQRRTLGL